VDSRANEVFILAKIVTIIGARPQFIKAAPLSGVLRRHFQEILVHTGQHYDENMSKVFFDELQIPKPEYNLGVGSGSHGKQTAQMLAGIEEVILAEQPDLVLVYGDTNSTLAGALAAAKLHIPVAHVEAGLRSFDKRMPEEQNRILTDHLSEYLLCPTLTAVKHLKTEGISNNVFMTGDIMYDSVLRNLGFARESFAINDVLAKLAPGLEPGGYNLLTIHRAENTDTPERFNEILAEVNSLPVPTLMPVHPRVQRFINPDQYTNIRFVPPVGYLEMLLLTENARKVITDSGGLQKEAFFLRVPCITVRTSTEWVETLEDGFNILLKDVKQMLVAYNQTVDWSKQRKLFGDGQAAVQITQALKTGLGV
jgi:UDP-GlcNAc3NAcA epimerase